MAEHQENIEDIINYFAISLFGQHTVDEILWDLAKNCISKLALEDCVIYLLDDERNVLIQKAAYGPKNPNNFTIYQPIEIPLGKGIVGSVAKNGRAEITADTSHDSRYIQDDAFRFSEIAVPIMLDGKVIGVIDCEHSERNFFTERHLKILTLIASLCANKLMWAKAEEKVKKEQQTLYETQQKLSEFEVYALRSQINPHFIFNALNAIQHFIASKNVNQALRYLSLFGKFIRKVLATAEHIHISLADEIEILVSYLDLEKLRFGNRFQYDISTGPGIDPSFHRIPVLLVQLFVAHSFTDRFLDSDGPGLLRIEFNKEGEFIVCRISSEGVNGSLPFDEPKQQELWAKIQERITLLNGLHSMNILVTLATPNDVEIKVPITGEYENE